MEGQQKVVSKLKCHPVRGCNTHLDSPGGAAVDAVSGGQDPGVGDHGGGAGPAGVVTPEVGEFGVCHARYIKILWCQPGGPLLQYYHYKI